MKSILPLTLDFYPEKKLWAYFSKYVEFCIKPDFKNLFFEGTIREMLETTLRIGYQLQESLSSALQKRPKTAWERKIFLRNRPLIVIIQPTPDVEIIKTCWFLCNTEGCFLFWQNIFPMLPGRY